MLRRELPGVLHPGIGLFSWVLLLVEHAAVEQSADLWFCLGWVEDVSHLLACADGLTDGMLSIMSFDAELPATGQHCRCRPAGRVLHDFQQRITSTLRRVLTGVHVRVRNLILLSCVQFFTVCLVVDFRVCAAEQGFLQGILINVTHVQHPSSSSHVLKSLTVIGTISPHFQPDG